MPSTGFAKMCFVLVALQVLLCRNLVSSSSIYVGRHEAGTISEQGPSESLVSEVNTCEDANKKVCRKIINFYGEEVCDTHDESLLSTVQNVCQSTCGFCTNEPACEDQVEDLCKEYGNFCNRGGDLGGLIKELCPKTCKSCHLKASKEESSLVVINE